jgi:spermidine synthase
MHQAVPVPARSTRALLIVCFLVTGGTGLVYEVLWSRHLQLLFGSTTEAVSVVLGVFMTGLGLGAHLLAPRVDASRSPLRAYGLLEIGVGAYALLTGPLLALVRVVYAGIASRTEPGLAAATLLKVILSAAVLFLPAFLMGATLPALVRALSSSADGARRTLPLLYGLNTLGAVGGTLGTGLVFLEVFGVSTTMLLCALVNLGVGTFALSRSRADGGSLRDAFPSPPAGDVSLLRALAGSRPGLFALAALFASGAATMGYEVVFTRVLGLVFGVSSYAFTIVLAVFLAGLALGALAAAGLAALRPPRLPDVTAAQAALACAALGALALLPAVPRLLLYLQQVPEPRFWSALAAKAALATFFLLPLSFVAGLSVPLLIDAVTRDLATVGRAIGSAYLVNTAGALAGSLATGFVLVPALGTEGALRALLVFTAATALLGAVLAEGSRALRVLAAAAALGAVAAAPVAGRWPKGIFVTSEYSQRRIRLSRVEVETALAGSNSEFLFLREGRNSTVAATRSETGRTLFVGAHPDASDGSTDMATQTLLGFVPLAAHPRPDDVFVIGFGSGVTADVAARFPNAGRVVIGELERAVVDASWAFRHVNHDVTANPKIRVVTDDARSVLQTTPRRFDVVVSEPSNPWRAGVANLFTADFYRSARGVIKPGGVFAQWTQLYLLSPESLRMILRTFHSVFPEVEVWWLDEHDIVLLGTQAPLAWSRARVEALLDGPFAAERRRAMRLGTAPEFWSRYLLGTKEVETFAGEGPRHTDDRPLLEFEAPRDLYGPPSQNGERLLSAKIASGALVPPHLDAAPPAEAAWLGIASMYEMAHEGADAAAARRRARASGATALGLVRDAAAALDAGDTLEAGALLEKARAFPLARQADVAREHGEAEGRLLAARGDLDGAARALEAVNEIEGPLGVELARSAANRGDAGRAFALAGRLLTAARLEGPVGQQEVSALWEMLRRHASRDPRGVLRLVRGAPPASAGFAEGARAFTEAVAAEAAGFPADAAAACARVEARGVVSLDLLGLHIRALRALGRTEEAEQLMDRLHRLAPLAITDPVPSAFPAAP